MKHTNLSQQYCALQAQERTELYNAVRKMNYIYVYGLKNAPVVVANIGDDVMEVRVLIVTTKDPDDIKLIIRPIDDVFQREIDIADVMIGYISCLLDALPEQSQTPVVETQPFDAWQYIAERLPDYYTNSDVAICNDLQCYLDKECDEITEKNIQRLLPGNRRTIEAYKHYIEAKLYIAAYETKTDNRKYNGKRKQLQGLCKK